MRKLRFGINPEAIKLHEKACLEGRDSYIDPDSGFMVFTELYHRKRGTCCRSECRHCPWNYRKSKEEDSST